MSRDRVSNEQPPNDRVSRRNDRRRRRLRWQRPVRGLRWWMRGAKRRTDRRGLRMVAYLASGMTPGDWWRLLRRPRAKVDPSYWPVLALPAVVSLWNEVQRRREEQLYAREIASLPIQPPIFLLGHWRSGTTLLHDLLAVDERFAHPTLFEVMRPHTFLVEEDAVSRVLGSRITPGRPMDGVPLTVASTAEDEWALAQMSLYSPMLSWIFPRHAVHHDRYLTFRGESEAVIEAWKGAFTRFMKKLTYRYQRPIVLKSPAHTGRIRLLLGLFPNARFVHIHRNPYHVYRSTRRFYHQAVSSLRLQRPPRGGVEKGILRRYNLLYDAFFEERDLIPEGRYCEVAFETLERDKLGEMRRIYDTLSLGDHGAVAPRLRAYVESIATYKKNRYPPLGRGLRRRIATAWWRSFAEWGYAV